MTVLNRRYQYLFIHVPKAAGKSVKQHLVAHSFSAGQRAALRFSFGLEALGSYAGSRPGASRIVPALHGPGIDRRLRDYCRQYGLYTTAHLRADQVAEALGDDFARLFRFAFVRNPWDRCLSAWFYFRRKPLHPLHRLASERTFEDFLREQEDNGMPYIGQQTQWLFRDYREQLVDFIGKVEEIDAGMAAVTARLSLPGPAFTARTNVSPARQRDYRGYYSDAAAEIVTRAMQPDIDLLGYRFG